MTRRLPVVAVVGRPNVGKSTLFNRVLGRREAIVDDRPGVTRDRNFSEADWAGRSFFLVDTGGVVEESREPLDKEVRDQALTAVDEADVIVLVVDSKEGPHPLDQAMAELLRGRGLPVIIAANKVDNHPRDPAYLEFWELGLGEPMPVSAISGKGSGDLLDRVVAALPEDGSHRADESDLRIAVIGKPNVGKSSFVNRLFGEDRMVVSDIPGTTRDAVDATLSYHGRRLVFVDTAGLRRQSRIDESIEYYSSLRTARVIRASQVCLVMIDAMEGLTLQDIRILEQAWEAGCGIVLAVNKWDLVEKDNHTVSTYMRGLRERVPFLEWVPAIFTSTVTGQRIRQTLDELLEVAEDRTRRVPTHEVNQVVEDLVRRQPPPHTRGRPIKIRYATQADTAPPTFVLFSNHPREIPDHYVRYLNNGFRRAWGFKGSPLRIRLRAQNREGAR
ncbi:MAG: ribosome biogenesis GTPase Der [Gemmatimonadales bacterium]|nr:MAG: ribosome biogenesis GTPase Der [Gemmatimonadales bacterium]